MSDPLEAEEVRQDLEAQVADRTSELKASLARAYSAQRLASLGTLAAGLGHDIANLLLPLRMRLDFLAERCPQESGGDIAAVNQAVSRLAQLAAGLRLLAMDPSREGVTKGVCELAVWWEQVEGVLRAALPAHVKLEGAFPHGLRPRLQDHVLAQAVFTLVQNAGEALAGCGEGLVRVSGSLVPGAEGTEGRIVLLVTDNGRGMSDEVASRCFEPYFSTKARTISTGMGLSMVRGMLEGAGGTISAAAGENRGTVMTITLPSASAAGVEVAQGGDVPSATAAVSIASARTGAFVVMMLRSLGVEVLGAPVARNGAAQPVGGPPQTDIWVVSDPSHEHLAEFMRGKAGDPTGAGVRSRRALVLTSEEAGFGAVRSPGDDGVIVLGAEPPLAELRAAITVTVRKGESQGETGTTGNARPTHRTNAP